MHNHLQFVVLTHNDGTIGIMQLMREPLLPENSSLFGYDHTSGSRDMSDEVIQFDIDRSAFDKPVVSWRRIHFQDLPTDGAFRAAWRDSGQHIYHDMPTCRQIHIERIRKARAPKLQALDVEYQRALEDNNVGYRNKVVAKKRKLRDATEDPRIEASTSIEELKAVWPLEE